MKLKAWHFYIWIASIIIFILFITGFAKYLSFVRKTSAVSNKSEPASLSKSFQPLACKGKTAFACTVKYLKYLRYLPISRTGHYRYEFSFPVPEVLQTVADSYAWNPQNPFILGAIAQYLEVSGRLHDGDYANPKINRKLLSELKKSAAKKEFDRQPWKWVLIRQATKGESVELYKNGRIFFSSPVNTGEYGTTPAGTWYIYLRYRITAMRGLSPARISIKTYESLKLKHSNAVGCLDGQPVKWVAYDDSDIKYVDYFNKGIALHYISRPHYGFPQSAGCVEMSYLNARFLYKNIGYGTVVTVLGVIKQKPAKNAGKGNPSAGETCTQPHAQPNQPRLSRNKN